MRAERIEPERVRSWFNKVLPHPVKWTGSEGKGRCPFHEDSTPSFSVNCEKGTWICYAGCGGGGLKELAERLGVPSFFEEDKPSGRKPEVLSAREYGYFDAGGVLRYQIVRRDMDDGTKKIWQRRPDGKGGWINDLKGVDALPYRLPELLEGISAGKGVIVAEGEKCADALAKRGFVATTNHGGAGKWRESLNKYFADCKFVVILPDNDKAGVPHARNVAANLSAPGRVVKIVDLGYPSVEKHSKDIYDWFAEGHTADELRVMIKDAPGWSPDDASRPPPRREREASSYTGGAETYRIVGGYRMSDAGNARRLVDRHGKDIRYCHKWKKWLVWDGKAWGEDSQYIVTRLFLETAKMMYADADELDDDREREKFLEFAVSSENRPRVKSALEIASDMPGVPIDPTELDADKYALNCQNGTLDLRTGILRAHRREDMLTKIVSCAWNESAKCPTWEKFVASTMCGNAELTQFLRRAIGYALTGSTGEQCFFILHGVGSNGKSTLLNAVRSLLRGYARQASADTFMAKRNNTAGPGDDIAALRGARFVSAIETEQSQSLAEAMIKQLTGGDIVSVRRLYENYFEFEPEFKIFLATNHKPNIRGNDHGIWRRIRLIPFEANIPDAQIDRTLPMKLREETEGILAWSVEGCLEWQDGGLMEPPEIRRATAEYKSEMDVIGAFLDEKCDEGEDFSTTNKELYSAFRDWCEDNGERELSQNTLSKRLVDRGFKRTRVSSRERGWMGLRVNGYL
jgi:putative DNA primase/helicase